MQRLEVSGAVRPIYVSLGIKRLMCPKMFTNLMGYIPLCVCALYPQERPSTHCTGVWVAPRAGLDRCGNSRLPPGFDLRTTQPVASRYIK